MPHSLSFCLTINFPSDLYESILARCCLLGMAGCEEQSTADRFVLKVFFSSENDARNAADELVVTPGLLVDSLDPVENQDWLAKWKESMKPARLSERFWVSPAWLAPPADAKHLIKIEPKMAFGTGHHETTRLASAAIIANAASIRGLKMLDIGSGSGVLCFVADLCGAISCTGVEIDPQCCENLAENLMQNQALGRIAFCIGTLTAFRGKGIFNNIAMNMLLRESTPLLDNIASFLADAGMLIWSGILDDESNEAIRLANRAGFSLEQESRENEWWCGVFRFS